MRRPKRRARSEWSASGPSIRRRSPPLSTCSTPSPKDVARARKMEAAYRAAEAEGLGAVQVDGVMIDVAVLRLARNTLNKADLIGM